MVLFSRSLKIGGLVLASSLWVSCATYDAGPQLPAPVQTPVQATPEIFAPPVEDGSLTLQPRVQGKSRWVPVAWSALPGWENDTLFEAWNAWLKSCGKPSPVWASLCREVRLLSLASEPEKRAWMVRRLQPYRVETLQGVAQGLLTSYYEPIFKAARQPGAGYAVPLYRLPTGWRKDQPWYTRQDIEALPQAQAALRGREIAWLQDPIDALVFHIQGSGRLQLEQPDGSVQTVRLVFAGSNAQPYRSVNTWLAAQGVSKLSPWPDAVKTWAQQNPQRVPELLGSNPRYIFFKEDPANDLDASLGPIGAQGVRLTAGRSIAVDPESVPYGAPVWMSSSGAAAALQKLVLAQDTGSAIVGAVRADYFAGTGPQAGVLAGRVNQPLYLWVLWPK